MTDYAKIYRERARDYERLVLREDYQERILPALREIRPLEGADVVELGAGTGRLTALLAPLAASVTAFDIEAPMLRVAREKLAGGAHQNWRLAVADHRALPVPAHSADLVISGWSVVYAVVWHPQNWRQELGRVLAEMERVARPGASLVILETQGTGHRTPNPPPNLLDYFTFLEDEAGFAAKGIRTDYRFASRAEAEELATFFFGPEMADRVEESAAGVVLPECTGIWWREAECN